MSSEVLARLKPFGISFEKSLNDLIKGIRVKSKESPEALAQFLDSALAECRSELRQTDLETKAMAILKLAYLEMYGFDMSWANFSILEVMSSSKFQQKRIGYLAAIQSFKNEQDLLILATNQFKKDLNSPNHAEIGLALSGIATIVTPNLSQDINDDVLMKLNHSSAYVRKKALLAMYKIFLQFPESLRQNFSRIIEKLDDSDVAVVSACVNVICEISKKSPKIFVNYLPKFFTILGETRNNWLIIRILKLFQSLSKVEPRMKKKIMPSIVELMLKTSASSLIYECINCIVQGQMLAADSSRDKETAVTCINKLKEFFLAKDSNLKFVGLLALINILKIYPSLITRVDGVHEVIMECLTDEDLIIKRKALEICQYLVTEDNIIEVVKVLLIQLIPKGFAVPESLKVEVSGKIISIAQHDNYDNIPNFRWYVAVLKDIVNLTLLPQAQNDGTVVTLQSQASSRLAKDIGHEFRSIATRVPSIRPVLLGKVVVPMVLDVRVYNNCPEILEDLYWILGEYCDELKPVDSEEDSDDDGDDNEEVQHSAYGLGKMIEVFNSVVNHFIDVRIGVEQPVFPVSKAVVTSLGTYPHVLTVLITTLVKLYNGIASQYCMAYGSNGMLAGKQYVELAYFLLKLVRFFNCWEAHPYYEVQERTLSWLEFLKVCLDALDVEKTYLNAKEEEEIAHFSVEKRQELAKELIESEEEVSDSSEDGYDALDTGDEHGDEDGDETGKAIGTEVPTINSDPELTANPFDEPRQVPFLLTHVLSSFFKSYQLNPVAKSAQANIPLPLDLDLSEPINNTPSMLVAQSGDDAYNVYADVPIERDLISLQSEEGLEQRKQERIERIKEDPYYIDFTPKSKSEEPSESMESGASASSEVSKRKRKPRRLKKEKVEILNEETIGGVGAGLESLKLEPKKKKKNHFAIDQSRLEGFDLSAAEETTDKNEYDADLDLIRQNLIAAQDAKEMPKKKKKKKKAEGEGEASEGTEVKKKKKKRKAVIS